MHIRHATDADWPGLWAIIEPVFRAGETYAIATDIDAAAARRYWVGQPAATFVVVDGDGLLLGSYFIKANQPGPGDHVCNCGYIVAETARGRGVAGALCEHSQAEAVRRGFTAMQYNCVVASNAGAIRLWQKLGFAIVGTLPGAFRHPREGHVDAHVLYKTLAAPRHE
ncbi:GNAT family N-acetyltransferase [Salinisphaera aquimarina]|uniref:GNAT family N-acetyltransferase n=1 Tax=Salinisphaera aquimarina TaxID=2094031 RepID=A0ABV7EQU8_9GAMM